MYALNNIVQFKWKPLNILLMSHKLMAGLTFGIGGNSVKLKSDSRCYSGIDMTRHHVGFDLMGIVRLRTTYSTQSRRRSLHKEWNIAYLFNILQNHDETGSWFLFLLLLTKDSDARALFEIRVNKPTVLILDPFQL